MFNLKLDKDKQKFFEAFLGDAYKELHTYQKWILQFQITKKDVDRFKKIEEFVKNGKIEFGQDKECD